MPQPELKWRHLQSASLTQQVQEIQPRVTPDRHSNVFLNIRDKN